MNTQQILNELTKYDRLVIHQFLSDTYSRRYIDYMFENGRKRTQLFQQVVLAYWNNKKELAGKVEGFIDEFKNKGELNGYLLHNTK